MQKKIFLILSGLLLLISFSITQTFGQEPSFAPAPSGPSGGWSAPIYHPEIGDKIVTVNNVRVYNEGDFRREIRNSPQAILLKIVDHRTGQYYHLRTQLWPTSYQTRLGIYIRTAGNYDGVVVTGFVPNSPGMRCQYMKGETTPVYDGGGAYGNGGWYYYDDDEDDDDDDYEYEYEYDDDDDDDGYYY